MFEQESQSEAAVLLEDNPGYPVLGLEWSVAERTELDDLMRRMAALPAEAPRALLSIRLSVLTDETTSPIRQELDLYRFALNRGCRVVGVARDLNVSATKVPPWKRPELGDWINNRAPEFDQILFWKLDRFVRRISDLHLMIEWCKEYSKVLAADKDPIDLDSAYGEMMVTMIAGMARIEAANTGVRLESLWKYARTTERWLIGKPVYGYTTEETPQGRRLVQDPQKVRVLRWIFAMLKRGRSMYRITQIVNRAGIPAPSGGKWYARNLMSILTNPALKGVRTIRPPKAKSKDISRIVYGTDGKPLQLAPPIFTDDEFNEMQAIHAHNSKHGSRESKKKLSRFLGVVKHGHCGENMYKHTTRKKRKSGKIDVYNTLRCSSYTREPCGGPTHPDADAVYASLADTVLEQLGDYEVIHRQYTRGAENLARVSDLEASIKHYMDGLEPGGSFAVGGFIQRQATETLQQLGAELSAIDPDTTQDRWEYKSKGVTYGEHWATMGMDQMEDDLVRAGITFVVYAEHADLLIPDDVKTRLVVRDDYFKKRL
ncbi:recombinase family protein [Streptomyces sp. H39-S7]|uniref:recombinase family protein n=1 Tax=Streptomyces sp. H39-S7 TaxID=3004357 RepID=UPI0022AFDC2F|nr:recombinase family protein [Streptomyces sp. H39-S7]MCZ4119006.1 recombinase family protein [Streptomyces sp. H39-S7]